MRNLELALCVSFCIILALGGIIISAGFKIIISSRFIFPIGYVVYLFLILMTFAACL